MNAVHITQGSGKMAGIQSINTPTTTNEFCLNMRKVKANAICKKCYAFRYESYRPSLVEALKRNLFLAERSLEIGEIPTIKDEIARFDSYGELINLIHFVNYMYIAAGNPHTIFTLWTKRLDIVQEALLTRSKPDNMILIYSSPVVDKQAVLPAGFDKVFTSYSKNTTTNINCHGSCNTCRLCYSHNDTVNINEIIK
jgi:hypothetical protein